MTTKQIASMLSDVARLEKAGGIFSTPYVLDVCCHVKALAAWCEELERDLHSLESQLAEEERKGPRMACNRCNIKDSCEFSGDLYNLDTEPKIDCLASK